ncbi:MAG TPA: thiopeptide-type bacteriocin biosynthesis protein, partial [Polyangiaceae bacterium]|nr:thiopeptide-type bacteriocin biosynthesis protein [Polyangiaceae bacterium]
RTRKQTNGWFQANVQLSSDRVAARDQALALFAALGPEIKRWRAQGELKRFFFMRKPPGLRLRFRFVERSALTRLQMRLHELGGQGAIQGWAPAIYEPEKYKWSPSLVPHVHAFFDADSAAFVRWFPRQRQGQSALTAPTLSLAVLSDLFSRATESRDEAWDVWCNLQRLHGSGMHNAVEPTGSARVREFESFGLRQLAERVPEPDRRLLLSYERTNTRFANALNNALHLGSLTQGPRAILAFLTMFHWNRWGLSLSERAALYEGMIDTLHPARSLKA